MFVSSRAKLKIEPNITTIFFQGSVVDLWLELWGVGRGLQVEPRQREQAGARRPAAAAAPPGAGSSGPDTR